MLFNFCQWQFILQKGHVFFFLGFCLHIFTYQSHERGAWWAHLSTSVHLSYFLIYWMFFLWCQLFWFSDVLRFMILFFFYQFLTFFLSLFLPIRFFLYALSISFFLQNLYMKLFVSVLHLINRFSNRCRLVLSKKRWHLKHNAGGFCFNFETFVRELAWWVK